ncbi:MAG: isoprenyl transferase [Pseudomonadota bacterium]
MSPVDKPTVSGKNTLQHISIIMDGNGRWAKKCFLPRFAGHKAGLNAVRSIVKYCVETKLDYLTLFAFSSENWRRPKKEVSLLMDLFATALGSEVKKLDKNNIKLNIIGNLSQFSPKLQEKIQKAIELTSANDGLTLTIAANYGGRWDITQAVKKIAGQIKSGHIKVAEIDESLIESNLLTHNIPEPDLFIRTGGEQRISNFLLWHLAYSEFFFTDTLWPDFDSELLSEAISSYYSRQRRFGRTGDQLEQR